MKQICESCLLKFTLSLLIMFGVLLVIDKCVSLLLSYLSITEKN